MTVAHLVPGHALAGRHRVTLSSSGPYAMAPPQLGARLLELAEAGPALEAPAAPERSQEEGAYFEAAVTAALLGAGDQLVLYRPAVDTEGLDLLVQLAGTAQHLYLQIKGTRRLDTSDDPRFQVRRRTFRPDPRTIYVFCYGELDQLWAVPAPELEARAAAGDADHISFEPRLDGPDPRWGHRRLRAGDLAAELVNQITMRRNLTQPLSR